MAVGLRITSIEHASTYNSYRNNDLLRQSVADDSFSVVFVFVSLVLLGASACPSHDLARFNICTMPPSTVSTLFDYPSTAYP